MIRKLSLFSLVAFIAVAVALWWWERDGIDACR
ncbi:MAG: hypothetical protein CM1200mP25_3500 [Acidobacteriota bacterium]|nr:MAG: hypothetical protein CM1200mP25_3500 [Acidobacteriota bacterium]